MIVSKKADLGAAFELAGRRGLTAAEASRIAGSAWRLRLAELKADGWRFREDRRRFGRQGVFRWVLVFAPAEEHPHVEESAPALFEPEAPRPASALEAA